VVRIVGLFLRIFSVAFHLFLGVVMAAIGFVAWVSAQHTLQMEFLPWQGPALTYWLLGGGIAGLVITLLAIRRVVPILFVFWSLAVIIMLLRGYFFSSYNFGAGSVSSALCLTAGSVLALAGSAAQMRQGRAVPRRQSVIV